MNILITSVGRRAYIVKYFKELLTKYDEVHVSNSDPSSVAFEYADKKVITPLIYEDNYISFLLEYCVNNQIDIIISLFDIDLLILSKSKQLFEERGIRVIVSNEDIISICNDKWLTHNFLLNNGFLSPKTYISLGKVLEDLSINKINYPIIIKPRFGCGSIGIIIAENYEELIFYSKKCLSQIAKTYLKYESSTVNLNEQLIYQERLNGIEYGADIINDLSGNFKNVIIREKIAMRSGETDIAKIVDNPEIYNCLKKLGDITKHVANMDCDIFLVEGKPYILELNARFGGGYPFSHIAGCNLPKAILKWVNNEKVDINIISARPGVLAYKEIYITEHKEESE